MIIVYIKKNRQKYVEIKNVSHFETKLSRSFHVFKKLIHYTVNLNDGKHDFPNLKMLSTLWFA